MGVCYRKGFEKGAWYDIKCVQDVIRSKESRGVDANMERNLLKSWSKYKGYEKAEKGLAKRARAPVSSRGKSKSSGIYPKESSQGQINTKEVKNVAPR